MSFDQLYWAMLGGSALAFVLALHPRLAAPAAFIIAGGLIYIQAFQFWNFVVDDAYISFRYAHNLAQGHGPVFNPGERVEGYTNFSWVLILSLTERAGLGIVTPARWLGYVADLATLGIMWKFARRLVPESEHRADAVFAAASIVFAALPATGYWATAGLDEPLFTFLATLALYRGVVEDSDGAARPYSAAAALAAALTRPEGIIVVVVLFGLKAIPAMRRRDTAAIRTLTIWCAIVMIPYLAYFGWRWQYYGYPFPNTYYQKVEGGPTFDWARYRDGLGYVRAFWVQTGAILLFPLPLIELVRSDRRRIAVPLVAFAVLWGAEVAYVGGDFMSFHRFLLPIIPITLLLSADCVLFLATQLRLDRTAWWRRPALMAVAVAIAAWLVVVPSKEDTSLNFRRSIRAVAPDIVMWLREQDPSTQVAIGAAGYIPYQTGLQTLDTLGLTDEHIAHGPRLSDDLNVQGHRKGDGRYVIDRRPDIIILAVSVTLFPKTALGWKTEPALLAADNLVLDQPNLWELYEPAWVNLPIGAFNFLRLKDSTRVQAERSPDISAAEVDSVRLKDVPGSCDNWILPRPQYRDDDGYFYLTAWGAVDGTPRRAVTEYRTDVPGSPDKVVEHYEEYMQLSHWLFTGTEHDEPESGAGDDFTIARFRSGNGPAVRTAFVAISDDGKRLITSTDFISSTEKPSALYRCVID